MVKRVEYLEETSPEALKALIDPLLAVASPAAAESRILKIECTLTGVPGSNIIIGGLTGVAGTDFAIGANAGEYATNIRTWINANLEDIPAQAVELDSTDVNITFPEGADSNAIEFSTTDPTINFTETAPGADAVETAALQGGVAVYVTRDRVNGGDYADTFHYVQALEKTTA